MEHPEMEHPTKETPMLVRDRMTQDPITIAPEASVHDAFRLINERGVHYLPVLDGRDRLVGVVTRMDLLRASPSAATTLTVFEANYLLAHLQVREVMTAPPITVPGDAPLEEAARLMVDRDISCLPVVDVVSRAQLAQRALGKPREQLVGIITQGDIFAAFVEILGGEDPVLRVTIRSPDVPGELARLTGLIAELGGNLHSVASFRTGDPAYVFFTFRLEGVEQDTLLPALEAAGEQVVHVCCTGV
jgi:acetoin utilization protein AcuB